MNGTNDTAANDTAAMDAIHAAMDGAFWDADLWDIIADIVLGKTTHDARAEPAGRIRTVPGRRERIAPGRQSCDGALSRDDAGWFHVSPELVAMFAEVQA